MSDIKERLARLIVEHAPSWQCDGDRGELQWVECDAAECGWVEPEDSTNGHAAHADHLADVLASAIREVQAKTRVFTAEEVIEIADETSDSLGNLYRLDFVNRIQHEVQP